MLVRTTQGLFGPRRKKQHGAMTGSGDERLRIRKGWRSGRRTVKGVSPKRRAMFVLTILKEYTGASELYHSNAPTQVLFVIWSQMLTVLPNV